MIEQDLGMEISGMDLPLFCLVIARGNLA